MKRWRLLNKFREDRTISSHVPYKKQRNIYVKLLRKIKRDFLNNVKCVAENRQLWKTVKPCLTDKTLNDERIFLIGNEKVVSDKRDLMKIFNEYFSFIVSNLDIYHPPSTTLHHDPVLNAMKKFKNHPSILEIKKINSVWCSFPPFSLRKVTLSEIINEIKNLDESKATQSKDIPTKVIKKSVTFLLLLLLQTLITLSKTLFS